MSEIQWKKLINKYQCPLPDCGYSLKQVDGVILETTYHKCINPECKFVISDKKLCSMTVIRHRKLEPPAFIEEMRNQDELNRL